MRVRRVAGGLLVVIAVLLMLYPVGIGLQLAGAALQGGGQGFDEVVGYSVSEAARTTITSLVIGLPLLLWGRSLVRKSNEERPPSE